MKPNMETQRAELRAEVERLRKALETIAGGWTDRFPGAPDVETAASPEAFRAAMWSWSQKVAKSALAALAKAKGETE